MKNRFILLALSVVFTIALVFASLELPRLVDHQLQESLNFLSFDQVANELNISKTQIYFEHYHLREIGYASLFFIALLVFLGFYLNRKSLSLLGAFALFIPVFGHFALSMFFLAGLGFLRVIWIPVTELSPYFMHYGCIIYLPGDIILSLGKLFGLYLDREIAIFFIIIGVLLFIMGVYVWFSTKFLKNNVATSFIYKISRHPQYLGWILWSYGLFLLPHESEIIKKSWGYADSLPWLLATMIIIAVSLMEEISMQKKYGDEYKDFKRNTSFMFPLPAWLKLFLKHPLRIFYNTSEFTKKRHVFAFTAYYTLVLIFISFIIFAFTEPSFDNPLLRNSKKKEIVYLTGQLQNNPSRRQKDIAAMSLERYGRLSVHYVLLALGSNDEITKGYAIRTLRNIFDTSVCNDLINACDDSSDFVLEEAIKTIGMMNCGQSGEMLLRNLKHPNQRIRDASAYAIGKTQLKEAIPVLLHQYDDLGKYSRVTYIEAFGNLRSTEALELLHIELRSEDRQIKEASVVALSKIGNKRSIPYLEKISLSDNWELSLYAREAIRIIRKNN